MALYEIMCETLENCEVLQNLKNPSFRKKKLKRNIICLKKNFGYS